jgi:hypothetical protein
MPKIADVLAAPADAYPAHVVDMAQDFQDGLAHYSGYAAEIASKLFINQDKLGLSANELVAAVQAVADVKQVIIDNGQRAFDVICKNVAPYVAPPPPPAPAPDAPAE